MASPFPFVKTNTKMGSIRYSVPTGITKYHRYSDRISNNTTSLGSYSSPSVSLSRRSSVSSSYPSTSYSRAASELPFIAPTRHSSINDTSFRVSMSRLKGHTLSHLSMI